MKQLNLFLIRLAIEDGAQQAAAAEIARQLTPQYDRSVLIEQNVNVDFEIRSADVTVDGTPVEWTEQPL